MCLALSRECGRPAAWEGKRMQPALERVQKSPVSNSLPKERRLQTADKNGSVIGRFCEWNLHVSASTEPRLLRCHILPLSRSSHSPRKNAKDTLFLQPHTCVQKHDLHDCQGALTGCAG